MTKTAWIYGNQNHPDGPEILPLEILAKLELKEYFCLFVEKKHMTGEKWGIILCMEASLLEI